MAKQNHHMPGPNLLPAVIGKYIDDLLNDLRKYMAARNGHTVTAQEAAADLAEIKTPLPGIRGHMIQIYRDGHIVTTDAIVSVRGGVLLVQGGEEDYELEAGDVISWIAY